MLTIHRVFSWELHVLKNAMQNSKEPKLAMFAMHGLTCYVRRSTLHLPMGCTYASCSCSQKTQAQPWSHGSSFLETSQGQSRETKLLRLLIEIRPVVESSIESLIIFFPDYKRRTHSTHGTASLIRVATSSKLLHPFDEPAAA
jgi:hypothetical protein